MTDREKLIELLDNIGVIVNVPVKVDEDGCGVYEIEGSEYVADYLLDNYVAVLPCREGATIYKIVKFCEENTGRKEFYRPSVEFESDCEYYSPQEWADDCEECTAQIVNDDYEPYYCSLNLDIYCEKCKERLAIQKDIFTLAKAHQVYDSPMFNENTELSDTYFRTREEAEKALAEHLNNK